MKVNTDSIRIARQQAIAEANAIRQKSLDSAREARQRTTDSIKEVRKAFTDSLAIVRAYRSSKHFKDSVASERQQRLDSIKDLRQAFNDSVKAERQKVTDSTVAARKAITDSIKNVQKQRSDSLAVIREYRASKRYKDSMALVRQMRLDSTQVARKASNDSLIAERKKNTDSATAVRKAYTDSLTAVRTKTADSLKDVRKKRAEELATAKAKREGLQKSREKKKEDKMQLALELKIKKKRKAWSNEKMLKKKWSAPRRAIQNTFTHYNYYFNADKKMDEALENMQRIGRDNYDSLIALFPFDPDRDSIALLADMDSIVQKASVGIQIHDPRTKWADDLYLLLGQAFYYKGNYPEASTSFKYIISMNQKRKADEMKKAAAKKKPVDKNVSIVEEDENKTLDFLKHKSVNNEAILWLARTYTESHNEEQAESILDLLESDSKFPDELKGRLALEKAYLNLSKKNYKAATEQLSIVAADDNLPNWVKLRAAYLNGQLLYEQGNYMKSAMQFEQVVAMNPKIEMDFYARKNLAYSLMAQGGSQETATASLKKLLKDGKYATYNEQVYYILGRLSANSNNPKDAITYLQKSIESPKSTRKQKAISFASLGDVYYDTRNYKAAKWAYDSASAFSRAAPDDSFVVRGVKRAVVLDKVTGPLQTIHEQDSLLLLAAVDDNKQRAVVRSYIRDLERKLSDSISRAENGTAAIKTVVEDSDPGAAGSWYFSNPLLLQQGYNDFKRKWGSRQNVDNWRRTGGTAFTNRASPGDEISSNLSNRGPSEASLLAMIPNTTEERSLTNQRIQKAYIDLANGYITNLDDNSSGIQTLDTLDARYKTHDHVAEDLFLRYKVALKNNKLVEAQRLSDLIRKDHGNTKWAKEVMPSSAGSSASTNGVSVSNFYDETYAMMMQRQYVDVLKRARAGQQQYNDPVYSNRFRIMEAIALAGSGSYNQADSLLTHFISTHPSDSLRNWAETVMNYVKKNKPVEPPKPILDSAVIKAITPKANTQPVGNNVSSKPSQNPFAPPSAALLREDNDSTQSQNAGNNSASTAMPAAYTYKPKEEHYYVFRFNKMESKALGLKAALNDFNTFNYNPQKLASSIDMLQETQGVIAIKSFPTATHAKIYLNAIKANSKLLKEYKPEEYDMMTISAENFRKLMADKDIVPYEKFYKANYK